MNHCIDPITKLAEQAIVEKVFPGCVVGIVNGKGERVVLPFGRSTKDIAYVILSNRTYPHRPADSLSVNNFRKSIGELVLC